MTSIFDRISDRLDEQQTKNLMWVGVCYFIWVIASIAGYFLLPREFVWICYGPVVFMALVLLITALIIAARPWLSPPIKFVYIGRKRITCCQFCPMVETKENPLSASIPILKCREMAKVCYAPMTIPRWCPYAD
jgi:hypothetical protein